MRKYINKRNPTYNSIIISIIQPINLVINSAL